MPRNKKPETVLAFPDAKERSTRRVFLPCDRCNDGVYVLALGSNQRLHYGLYQGDSLMIDPAQSPVDGDLVAIEDPEDDSGKSVTMFVESSIGDTKILGTVIGFQRMFLK